MLFDRQVDNFVKYIYHKFVKKKLPLNKLLFILIAISLIAAVLSACNGETSFTVKFFDGGILVSEKIVTSGGNVVAPPNPSKDGYTFSGWKAGDKIITDRIIKDVKSDLTLYAVYSENEYSLSVTWDKTKGNVIMPTETKYKYRQSVEIKADPESGYEFIGFLYGDVLIKDNPYNFSMPHSDVTLEAVFSGKNTSVKLNSNGGTFANDKTELTKVATFGERAAFETPTKNECVFVGYFTDDGTQITSSDGVAEKWTFSGSEITLTAKWETVKYSVSLVTDELKGSAIIGSQYTVTYNYNGAVSSSATSETVSFSNPPKFNYATGKIDDKDVLLVGYYTDAELTSLWDRSYVTSDVTLYAKWFSTNGNYHLNVGMLNTFTFYKNQQNKYNIYFSTAMTNSATFNFSGSAIYQLNYVLRKADGTTLIPNKTIEINTTEQSLSFDDLESGEVYQLEIVPTFKNTSKDRTFSITQQKPADLQPKTSFDSGSQVTVTAVANGESVFDGWYDGDVKVSSDLVYIFDISKNVSLEAKWK